MIKHIFIFAILFFAIFSVNVVGEEEYPILDKQVEIRQAHIAWKLKIQEIGMDASIDYIDGISNGTGSSDISSILDDFIDQTDLISTLTTHIALNNAIRQIIQITTDFRLELRDLIKEYNGRGIDLLNRIKTAVDENESVIESLENTYWQIRKTNALDIFDMLMEGMTLSNVAKSLGISYYWARRVWGEQIVDPIKKAELFSENEWALS